MSDPANRRRLNPYERFAILGLIPAAPVLVGPWALIVRQSVAGFTACVVASMALFVSAHFRRRRMDGRRLDQ